MKRQSKKRQAFTLIKPKAYDRTMDSDKSSMGHDSIDKLKRDSKTAAFTLIEIIVVMAVIGILVLLAAPKFLGYTERAQETKHIHTAKVIETALEAYLINGGAFPDDLEVVGKDLLAEAADEKTLIGVDGYITTIDDETYYELTYNFIQKLDVKLSTKNKLLIEARASSVPTAIYASEKGIAMVDKDKTLRGYELQQGELPNEIGTDAIYQLAAGNGHSFAIMNNGTVMAWGNNDAYQLGDGTNQNRYSPVIIDSLQGAKQLIAGNKISLALMNDGTVKAWGDNSSGQLGITASGKIYPTDIGLSGVKEIILGHLHVMALMNDGTVMTWGDNRYGQLGDGTTSTRTTPVQINTLLKPVRQLRAGYYHSVALMNDGTVMAWGYNSYGSLGDGTLVNSSIPVVTKNLSNVNKLAAGHYHTLALLHDGSIKSWGFNGFGQLGDGTNINKSTPLLIPDLLEIKHIAAGAMYSGAITSQDTVITWGKNEYGQLGDNSNVNKNTPQLILGMSEVSDISLGYYHALAQLKDGRLLSWGSNQYGQLGDTTIVHKNTPVQVKKSDGTTFNINDN